MTIALRDRRSCEPGGTIAPMVRSHDVGDADLVEAAAAGDHRAFTTLLRRHDPAMRRLASSMMYRPDAVDDVLQDAYVQAYRALPRFRREAAFSTWLHRIVYRVCIDHQRRARPVDSLDLIAEMSDPRADDVPDQLALGDVLRRALASLSPDHQAILVLVDLEGHSYEETARILETGHGTVGSRLNRARAALRVAYEAHNVGERAS